MTSIPRRVRILAPKLLLAVRLSDHTFLTFQLTPVNTFSRENRKPLREGWRGTVSSARAWRVECHSATWQSRDTAWQSAAARPLTTPCLGALSRDSDPGRERWKTARRRESCQSARTWLLPLHIPPLKQQAGRRGNRRSSPDGTPDDIAVVIGTDQPRISAKRGAAGSRVSPRDVDPVLPRATPAPRRHDRDKGTKVTQERVARDEVRRHPSAGRRARSR